QRDNPSGTATSAAPRSGTSLQPSSRAARAGYSAVRSGDDVKIALSTSSGRNPLASWSARNSSAVALRIASREFAAAVVAPRSPRRVLVMALADQLRLMVLTDAALLKGRDPVAECRQAARGGATMIRVRGWRADYWSVGPCFATENKPDAGPPLGTEGFARLARLAPTGTPVIAIGGISASNAAAVARAGAAGIAVIGAVWGATDRAGAARALRAAFP